MDSDQYQGLLRVDLGGFSQPGEYRLQVDGLGASFPFRIGDEVPMKFARTYALGLYQQRCGTGETIGGHKYQVNDMPFTRFIHGDCHTALASIPLPDTVGGPFSDEWWSDWGIVSFGTDPRKLTLVDQHAQQLDSAADELFKFGVQNNPKVQSIDGEYKLDVSGGHHDAGDYSKYTINSAQFIHTLIFAADNFPGVIEFDNLGIPESGDGTPDILQEAKWEADFLLKMQDNGTLDNGNNPVEPGGFYTLVYPRTTPYEASVLPDHGDAQVVWPKTTSVTAAAVAALAETGSSPAFCDAFSLDHTTASRWTTNPYLIAAKAGWDFLMSAMDSPGKDNSFQRLYQYGDEFSHNDELAWAAAAMFAAGYSDVSHLNHDPENLLIHNNDGNGWYPHPEIANSPVPYSYDGSPNDPCSIENGPCPTWKFSWWGMSGGYGCAIRDVAFAVKSQRRSESDFDSAADAYFLACQEAAVNWGHIVRSWSENNAYRNPLTTSQNVGHGWHPEGDFPVSWAFDIAVGDSLDTALSDHDRNLAAILGGLNFEAGCNPNNVGFLAGLGWRRQRVVVNQYYWNAGHVFPPTGNAIAGVNHFQDTGSAFLKSLFYPPAQDFNTAGFALYDRWADAKMDKSEFVGVYTARSLAVAAWLAAQTSANVSQPWGVQLTGDAQITAGTIDFVAGNPALGTPAKAQLMSSHDLTGARIVWDVLGGQPHIGPTLFFDRSTVGESQIEAEATLPDGRRVFGPTTTVYVNDPQNGGQPLTAGSSTVALYHLDNNLNDSETADPAHPHNLTIQSGSVTFSDNTTWMKTPSGKVASFAGIGDSLTATIPYSSLQGGLTGLAIEFRLYVKQLPGSGLTLFSFSGQPSGNTSSEWSIGYRTDLAPNPYFEAPNDYVVPNNSVSQSSDIWASKMTPNTWHAIKITATPAGLTSVYIDDMTTPAATATHTVNWSVTNWQLSMGNFIGYIDELRISNTTTP